MIPLPIIATSRGCFERNLGSETRLGMVEGAVVEFDKGVVEEAIVDDGRRERCLRSLRGRRTFMMKPSSSSASTPYVW